MLSSTQPALSVESVIFDMDGLLIDTESLAMQALVSAGAEISYEMPVSFCHLMIGVPLDHNRKLVIERFGDDFPVDSYFTTADRHFTALINSGLLRLKPGVLELLSLLEQTGIRKAVATSSARHKADHHLELTGIRERFDAIITRDDVICGKPNPDPFLRAAEALGTRPDHCLALEDSYNGVRAAYAAGMRVIMVPDLLEPTDEMHEKAFMVMKNLYFVADHMRKIHALN
jgi:HAD superfamily hydrolase (TIGR01509 family)